MNYRFVMRQLGLLLIVLSAAMLLITGLEYALWSGGASDTLARWALGITVMVGVGVGAVLWLIGRAGDYERMGRRDALLLVALSWIIGAGLAGLPFFLWAWSNRETYPDHRFLSYVACYFEAMSGLTTTGATVLDDIRTLPPGLLLWRSATHWLGGLGIVVLFVAVLPTLGVGGKRLFNVEAPGPAQAGVRPRIAETARALWLIYLGLTAAAFLCLKIAGMSWFDSLCHTLSMVSTGGLSTRNASIGHYDSVAIDLICIVFMLLAGVNFALFYAVTRGRWRIMWKDQELRVYLTLKFAVIILVTANIVGLPIMTTAGETVDGTVGQALRYAGFQTVAMHTGTGFCTADFDIWPFLSRTLLIGLMFIGGCAGSTAGGVKVIRFWIMIKVVAGSLEKAFRPQVVRPLKVGKSTVDEQMQLSAMIYVVLFGVIGAIGATLIAAFEGYAGRPDFQTAMSAAISTLGNIGPGLHEVGPTKTYAWFSDASLAVMSLLMLLGRIEVYAIAVFLLPRFWKGD